MVSVSRREGFRYGFYVFGYWVVLLAFSAALVAAGGIIVTVRNEFSAVPSEAVVVLGGFVGVVGVLVFGAGQTGLVYKVIADGVRTGIGSIDAQQWLAPEPAPDQGQDPAGAMEPCREDATAAKRQPEGATSPSGEATDEPTTETEPDTSDVEPTRSDTSADSTEDWGRAPGVEPGDERAGTGDSGTGDAGSEGDAREQSAGDEGAGGSPGTETAPDDAATGDRSADAFESGGFEPASRSEEPEEPEDSPVDVASESEIAAELGFGDQEAAAGSSEAGARADPGEVDESDDTSPTDDPLAPDSEFDPPDAGESAEPAATPDSPLFEEPDASESGAERTPTDSDTPPLTPEDSDEADDDVASESPDWTTGEDHMGGSTRADENDEPGDTER